MRWLLAVGLATTTACPNDPGDSTDSGNTLAADSTLTTAPAEDSSSTTDAVDESTTSAPSTTVSDESSSGGGALGCSNANPCAAGYCVAPYADNDHGDYVCIADCVVPGDEASWCFDASSCCDPEATCTERGYCVLPDDTTGSSSSTG